MFKDYFLKTVAGEVIHIGKVVPGFVFCFSAYTEPDDIMSVADWEDQITIYKSFGSIIIDVDEQEITQENFWDAVEATRGLRSIVKPKSDTNQMWFDEFDFVLRDF